MMTQFTNTYMYIISLKILGWYTALSLWEDQSTNNKETNELPTSQPPSKTFFKGYDTVMNCVV